MKPRIFYSWQSDIQPGAACRSFIQQALEAAAKEIGEDGAIEPVIDRDTQDVPGCPDIGATILSKIDTSSAFVADVTIVGTTVSGKPTPNPNVLLEVGYALKSLGWERIVLIMNEAFGKPEQLPFDLRQKRALVYSSPGTEGADRSRERKELQKRLRGALASIVGLAAPSVRSDVALSLDYTRLPNSSAEVHHYEVHAVLTNTGTKRWDDWVFEVEAPTQLLNTGVIVGIKVDERSDAERSLFRTSNERMKASILPGDRRKISLGYRIDREIYWEHRHELFPQLVSARAYVDGELVAKVERPVSELQNF